MESDKDTCVSFESLVSGIFFLLESSLLDLVRCRREDLDLDFYLKVEFLRA